MYIANWTSFKIFLTFSHIESENTVTLLWNSQRMLVQYRWKNLLQENCLPLGIFTSNNSQLLSLTMKALMQILNLPLSIVASDYKSTILNIIFLWIPSFGVCIRWPLTIYAIKSRVWQITVLSTDDKAMISLIHCDHVI